MKVGDKALDFSLKNQDDKLVSLKDFNGKYIILYFYPKDNTPGCTIEANEFTSYIKDFEKLNAVIIGVSPDPVKSHCNFIDKYKLKINLLSDPEHKVLEKYNVWKEKSMYGKKYMGVHRSTFLINPIGKIIALWSTVKPEGHAEEVFKKLQSCF